MIGAALDGRNQHVSRCSVYGHPPWMATGGCQVIPAPWGQTPFVAKDQRILRPGLLEEPQEEQGGKEWCACVFGQIGWEEGERIGGVCVCVVAFHKLLCVFGVSGLWFVTRVLDCVAEVRAGVKKLSSKASASRTGRNG